MFYGSIPGDVQKISGEIIKSWDVTDIYVGCSGNFTVEKLIYGATPARLHGNDVTIYSCMLGDYFAGNKLNVKFNPEYHGPMEFVEKYLTDDPSTISVILLLSKLSQALKAKKKNPYYERIINAYKEQWDVLFNTTKERVEQFPKILSSFHTGDVCEWIKTLDKNQAFVSYPPFFAGDYEKMFKALEEILLWEPPVYEILDKERVYALFDEIMEFKYFLFAVNEEMVDLQENLVGLSQTTNRGAPIYIYSNYTKSRIVMPSQKITTPMLQRLGEDEAVGEKMTIVKLESGEFQSLRSHYMNCHIKPGSESMALGVMVDEKLIGVYALSSSPTQSNWDKHVATPTIYLLSDFPVYPSRYKRLAKLVLYAALSSESKLIMETLCNKRVKTLITTAFSRNPVSMKYRGLFDLVKKDEASDAEKLVGNKYRLGYAASPGGWTLQEGLEIWKVKHGQMEQREGSY